LSRAQLLVTHGGMASVRHALHFGVPSVVLPCSYDNIGIAARLDHLGVARVLDASRVTAGVLGQAVQSLMGRKDALERLATLSRELQSGKELNAVVERLERFIQTRSELP
jgi:zeaxanthin glucosyltransferase